MEDEQTTDAEEPDYYGHLPHWARVAWAAKCVRWVLPLFGRNISGISQERIDGLAAAIACVEQSAAEGRASDELETRLNHVIMASGAARRCVYDRPEDQSPSPKEVQSVECSDHVTNAAAWAIRTAQSEPAASADFMLGTWMRAGEAAHVVGVAEKMKNSMVDQFVLLRLVCLKNGWDDQMKIPPEIFETLEAQVFAGKKWWKKWLWRLWK